MYLSGTTTLSVKRGRCALPKEIVERWGLEGKAEKLHAVVRGNGHVSLHRHGSIQKQIDEAMALAGEQQNPSIRGRELRKLHDRFRFAQFSATDNNRLTFEQPIVLALAGDREVPARVKLLVEFDAVSVDLLSNEARFKRNSEDDEDGV